MISTVRHDSITLSGIVDNSDTPQLLSELRSRPDPVIAKPAALLEHRMGAINTELAALRRPVALEMFSGSLPMDDARQVLHKLRDEHAKALPVERRPLGDVIEELNRQITDRDYGVNQCLSRLTALRDTVDQVCQRYQHAEVLDLSVLGAFFHSSGLPRLALIEPFRDIEYSAFPLGDSDHRGMFPRSVLSVETDWSLIDHFLAFSGCFPHAYLESSEWTSAKNRAIEIARRLHPSISDLPATAKVMSFIPEFGQRIPEEAREIINLAKAAKVGEEPLFDRVVLLAEVPGWKFTTGQWLQGDPFIEPHQIIPSPPSKDPLILGIKRINGERIAFLLGAFNTTKLEEYIQREWVTKG
jgi:hypothetical protein